MSAFKVIFCFLFIMTTCMSAIGQEDKPDCLYQFVKNNKYGFKNLKGEIIAPAIYNEVTRFKNGFARVAVKTTRPQKLGFYPEKHWGLINNKGTLVADTIYAFVSDMSNEGVAILVQEDKLGVINKNGELVSPFVFQTSPWLFSELTFANGLLPVLVFRGYSYSGWHGGYKWEPRLFRSPVKVGFIDRRGKLVIDTVWELNSVLGNRDDDEETSFRRICGSAQNSRLSNPFPEVVRPHPYYVKSGYYTFSNGRCVVSKRGENIVIDTLGNTVFKIPGHDGYPQIWKIEDKNGFLLIHYYDPVNDESSFGNDKSIVYIEILTRQGVPVPIPENYEPIGTSHGNVVIAHKHAYMKYKLIDVNGNSISDIDHWE